MIINKSKHTTKHPNKFLFWSCSRVDKSCSVECLYVIIFCYVFLYAPWLTHMGIWMVKFERLRLKFKHLIQKDIPSLHKVILCNIIFHLKLRMLESSYENNWVKHINSNSLLILDMLCHLYSFMNTNRSKCVFHTL